MPNNKRTANSPLDTGTQVTSPDLAGASQALPQSQPTPHVAPVSQPATTAAERIVTSAPNAGHPAPTGATPVDHAAHGHASGPILTRLPCPPPHTLGSCAPCDAVSPAERYGELFVAVQRSAVFADSKTFPDCVPELPPEIILERYRAQCAAPDFSLPDFVSEHFSLQAVPSSEYVSDPDNSLVEHIDGLWPVLTREPREHRPFSSLLPLPYPYVVPGGRFGELYYWDSYFTMLGLEASGRHDLVRAMTDNFAYLIDTYGHIPNGTRSYYLSRSQPPVFALMTTLFAAGKPEAALSYLPRLRREHAFWMHGAETLPAGCAHRRVVRLPDGCLLNRYWDDHAHPREEAYAEDTETAKRSARPCHVVFRDLRAAAESGWDFSSRWLDDLDSLSSIRTTALLPVDLNALLWHAEQHIATLCDTSGDSAGAAHYRALAEARQRAMERYLWDEQAGTWTDFDWHRGVPRQMLTAAIAMPMFVGLGDRERAARVATAIETRLLVAGGIATTEMLSAQQWDQPNGWAPLQWIAIEGLRRHGFHTLADTIARRWLATVENLYTREGKLVEKYMLQHGHPAQGGDGGEYPLQDGFGWTNGVVRALLRQDVGSGASAAHPTAVSAD